MLLFAQLYAGTVTLTGTCQHVDSGNYISFSLSNSGNDTAYNIRILPYISKATINNSGYQINSLGPEDSSSIKIGLSNVSAFGTYVDYIDALYQQDSSIFAAVFPCQVNFGENAGSNLIISYSESSKGYYYQINVTAVNAGRYGVDANFSLILPPGLTYSGNGARINIGPLSSKSVDFTIYMNKTGVSYSGAAVASYIENNTEHAAMTGIVLATPSPETFSIGEEMLIAVVAVVAIFAVLIARIAMKRKVRA